MMVSKPVVSSMRSRHTGHVGSSISAGVGGASGLVERVAEGMELDCVVEMGVVRTGLVAACGERRPVCDPVDSAPGSTACISTVFTKTT